MDNLVALIKELSEDPFNPALNYEVANEYLALGQSASAVSFFLRCAEYGEQGILVYGSLCQIARCFDSQTNREYSVSNTLLQAIALDDSRPEAYFLLSQFHERQRQWQECYTFATLGKRYGSNKMRNLSVGYLGEYCFDFELAVAAYWIGRRDESFNLFKKLDAMEIASEYREAVKSNLEKLNAGF